MSDDKSMPKVDTKRLRELCETAEKQRSGHRSGDFSEGHVLAMAEAKLLGWMKRGGLVELLDEIEWLRTKL